MDSKTHKRLKVLLSCYACAPYRGSEPGTGWNFVVNIARYHDVHVIVEEGKFRECLEKFSREHPDDVKNITFHYVLKQRHKRLRKIWPPSYYWFYRAWHKRVFLLAKELDEKENFDIVHHVNFVGYREPGYLWKLGKPFVWGPLGGLGNTPWCLLTEAGFKDAIFYTFRNIINSWQKRFSYAARVVSQKAFAIFVSDPEGQKTVQKLWNRGSTVMREVGTCEMSQMPELAVHRSEEPLRVCWVGVCEARKALPILLKALPHCSHAVEVEVLGSGVKERSWKQLACDLGIEKSVHFHGHIPHSEVFNVMRKCHVMCITSIHEGGTPNIVMEGIQNGLPIIALNHCGYATVVDETCGIKIPVQSQKKVSAQLAVELDNLASDEDFRMRLARGAVDRSKEYTWSAKMQVLNRVYEDACQQK